MVYKNNSCIYIHLHNVFSYSNNLQILHRSRVALYWLCYNIFCCLNNSNLSNSTVITMFAYSYMLFINNSDNTSPPQHCNLLKVTYNNCKNSEFYIPAFDYRGCYFTGGEEDHSRVILDDRRSDSGNFKEYRSNVDTSSGDENVVQRDCYSTLSPTHFLCK